MAIKSLQTCWFFVCLSLRSLLQENVEGYHCNRCKPNTFGLSVRNPLGCSKCYCYGLTQSCMEAQGLIRMWVSRPCLIRALITRLNICKPLRGAVSILRFECDIGYILTTFTWRIALRWGGGWAKGWRRRVKEEQEEEGWTGKEKNESLLERGRFSLNHWIVRLHWVEWDPLTHSLTQTHAHACTARHNIGEPYSYTTQNMHINIEYPRKHTHSHNSHTQHTQLPLQRIS